MAEMQGLKISLLVSDPWEFGEGPYSGEVLVYSSDSDDDKLLLQLTPGVFFKEQTHEYFIVSPRSTEKLIEAKKAKAINCNLVSISKEKANSNNPLDTSDWRGSVALIGSIRI